MWTGWLTAALFGVSSLAAGLAWLRAANANRRTSLIYSVLWGSAAWVALSAAYLIPHTTIAFLALVLECCAGVSVLGARRPGVAAWQFVVLGLGAILLLPLGESLIHDRPVEFSGPRMAFLVGLTAMIVLNYLLTRLGLAAVLLGLATAAVQDKIRLNWDTSPHARLCASLLVSSAPLVGWLALRLRRAAAPADRLWLTFRDRFGAIWALRVQDQFNRAAANANIDARLRWRGVRGTAHAEAYDLLVALLKRFGLPAHMPGPTP